MSRNKKRKKERLAAGIVEESARPSAGSVVPLRPVGSPLPAGRASSSADSAAAGFEDVRRAIERQSYKSALEKAKELHKKLASEESKALLIDAYIARIQGMLTKDLAAEARALADLVAARFPEAAGWLAGLQRELAAQTGDVAALAAPLADPNAAPQARAEAEQALRKELVDLPALAASGALPEGHPLRVAAADLARAFAAVTAGEVDDTVIELASVSHRSPLAAWKILIRAIANLYRGQDESCRQALAALGDDSAPGRAAGVLQSVLNESWDESLTPAGRRLVERIMGPRIELGTALRTLDELFSRRSDSQLYRQIRLAVQLCQRACPQMLERLRQHISVKAAVMDYPVEPVVSALGGPAQNDAYFFRLFARAIENTHSFVEACELWDRFRSAAIREGLFPADGPENAFLYLHMAELLRRIEPDHLREAQQDFLDQIDEWGDFDEEDLDSLGTPRRRSRVQRDLYFLAPERLYERAAALRPDAEVYRQWLDYVGLAEQPDLGGDPVAQKWAADFPEDPRPLLYLARSAEQREAYDKALKYIGQAEQLGGVDPKVKRARFRLLVAKAVRHLKQVKPDLTVKDFVQIEQLPQAAEKDRPAFLLSLKWVHAVLQGDRAEVARLHDQVCGLLGGPVAAAVLLLSTARKCDVTSAEGNERLKWLTAYKEKDIVNAIARAYQIGSDVDVEMLLPVKWGAMLAKWLKRSDCDLDSAGLLTVAQAALVAEWPEVAYYCCGYGLQKGGPLQARFMFLRGKSLPYSVETRRQDCFAAALELAKRVRDMDLVAEIADAGRRMLNPFGGFNRLGPDMLDAGDLGMDDQTLKTVTDSECRTRKYPKGSRWPFFSGGRPPAPCQCPACRRARGELPARRGGRKSRRDPEERYLFDDVFAEEEFEDEFAEVGSDAPVLNRAKGPLPGLPPELGKLMAELVRINGGRIPRSKRELDQIIARHPELLRELASVMPPIELEDELGPLDELESDGFPDIEDEPPSRPFWPPFGGRGRRKKKRRR
jgi:hypothetical protein